MVKKVSTKKMPRKISPRHSGTDLADLSMREAERLRMTTNVTIKPRMNLGKRCQISPALPCRRRLGLIFGPDLARMKVQTPMKMSMNTLTVVGRPASSPAGVGRLLPPLGPDQRSLIAPPATAAPSVLTASPIHAPATTARWRGRSGRGRAGSYLHDGEDHDQRGDHDRDDGRARIAPPVAMRRDAADRIARCRAARPIRG